jgi:hypothetical protein
MNRLKIYRQTAKAESTEEIATVSQCILPEAEKMPDFASEDSEKCASMVATELEGVVVKGPKKLLLLPPTEPNKGLCTTSVSSRNNPASSGVLISKKMHHVVDAMPHNVTAVTSAPVQNDSPVTSCQLNASDGNTVAATRQCQIAAKVTVSLPEHQNLIKAIAVAPTCNQISVTLPQIQATGQGAVPYGIVARMAQPNVPLLQVINIPSVSTPQFITAGPSSLPQFQVASIMPAASSHIMSCNSSTSTHQIRLIRIPAGSLPQLPITGIPVGIYPKLDASATVVSAASDKRIVMIPKSCIALQTVMKEENTPSADAVVEKENPMTSAGIMDTNNNSHGTTIFYLLVEYCS